MGAVDAVTKSTAAGSFEFVFHISSEYDYRFVGELRDEIIQTLKEVYLQVRSCNLPVYGVPKSSLKQFVSNKSDREAKRPEESFRLATENLVAEAETKREWNEEDDPFREIGAAARIYSRAKGCEKEISQFRLVRFVSKSVHERIFVVEHVATAKLFRMKELRKDFLLDTDKVTGEKVETEAKKCVHPFVCTPELVFRAPGRLYLLFEITNGGDLLALLNKHKRFPEDRAQFYVAQIVIALEHLHSQGIVLRDLRPETVYFDSSGYIKLDPFSTYMFVEGEEKRRLVTALAANLPEERRYLAPEALAGEEAGAVADWWALGVIVYQMLVGIPPFFAGEKDKETLRRFMQGKSVPYPDPVRYHIMVSDDAKDFIARVFSLLIPSRIVARQIAHQQAWVRP